MLNRITRVCKDLFYDNAVYVFVGVITYFIVANAVFSIRHPWATDMERFIHVGDALMFNKVSYKQMRDSYEKE